ncbi:MAG: Wzz/FepE/Etk N-terminal domain-containing protein, partial [Pseudomonadota bacterium]
MERSGDITQHEDEVEEGFGFEDMLRILRRHWRIILSVTLTAAAIATQLSLTMPNTYVAVATVQVEQRKKKIVDIDEVIQEISVNTQAVETEVEILSSSTLALRVIDKLGLRRDPEFNEQGWSFPSISALFGVKPSTAMPQPAPPSPLDKLAQRAASGADPSVADYLKTLAGGERALSRDTVLQAYLERLKTSRIRNSHLIEVAFVSESPTKSAQIVNTIVATYLEDQINAKTGANKLATDLLNKKIVDMREKLNVAERKLETFKAKNDLFDADGRFVLDRQLNREMEALVKASAETAETRARFDQARSMISRGET